MCSAVIESTVSQSDREQALAVEFNPAATAEDRERAWQAFTAVARTRADAEVAVASAVPFLINNGTGNASAADDLKQLTQALAVLRPVRDAQAPAYAMAVGLAAYRQALLLGNPTEALAVVGDTDQWYSGWLAGVPADRRAPEQYNAQARLAFGIGKTMSQLGRYKEAAAFQKRNWESMSRARGPNDAFTNSAEQAYATALYLAGRGDEAEQVARDAAEIAAAHFAPADPQIGTAFSTLAQLLVRGGKRYEALDYIRRSVDISRKAVGSSDTRTLAALYAMGDVLTALERYPDADAALLTAARGFDAAERDSGRATLALAKAGIVELATDQPRASAINLEKALLTARTRDAKERAIGTLVLPVLILALHDIGREQDARDYATQLVQELRIGDPFPIEIAQADLLAAYVGPGGVKSDAARVAARRVVDIVRDKRELAASGQLPQGDRTALDIALRVAAETDDAQLALDAMIVLTGSKIAQASHLLAEREAASDPALTARIRALQDAVRDGQAADKAMLAILVKGGDVAEARLRSDAARAQAASQRAAMIHAFPRWSEASGVDAVDIAALRRTLSPSQAILAVVPAFDGVYTLLVTRSDARVRRTALGRQAVTDLAVRLRRSISLLGIDRSAASALYRQLFPASDSRLLRGITSLRIVPGGVFASLPFGVLLQPAVHGVSTPPWLIKRFALSMSPRFLPDASVPSRSNEHLTLLGIGAPTPFGTPSAPATLSARRYFRGGGIDATALAELPLLPDSAKEVAGVARYFGPSATTVLLGDNASESRLKAMDLKPYSTILFSTHGLVSGDLEGLAEPALVLAKPRSGGTEDGLLTASEIAVLRFDADWIILSACNTAAGDGDEAPAYSGLAQAFRYAGARSLLLSHWPVRDDAARFITVETIAGTRRGIPKDVALQLATLALMSSRSFPDASSPYIWAPFVLLGTTAN